MIMGYKSVSESFFLEGACFRNEVTVLYLHFWKINKVEVKASG